MHSVIIVGAGPAGLSAAHSLTSLGINDFLLIERGQPLAKRQRSCPEDIPSGVGGAGLFSDGKFSFFPSATWLWKNLSSDYLSKAYDWLKKALENYGVYPPGFHDRPSEQMMLNNVFKAYPSFYINFDDRYNMIDDWGKTFSANTLTNTDVINIEKQCDGYRLTTNNGLFFAKKIIIATGRMGPLQLPSYTLPISQAFQRIEVGVRIKGPHTHPFFAELLQHGKFLDPKFIFTDQHHPEVSWRTFCFCKRGEILPSGNNDYFTLSGRADCPATDESNIGFNTRIKLPAMSHLLPKLAEPFALNLGNVYSNPSLLSPYFKPDVAQYVFLGFMKLKEHFSSLADAHPLEIVGPTIEGVGNYPIVTNELQTAHPGLYIAGDLLGLFRGLTAALLSGHYIGQTLGHELKTPT
jgi:uncharacterized FAD-dependent dehydrogenase